ncbi:hypothetical protein [Pyxidicoccus trucidator]|uniref:hypothetical protein n=1 Tax=Pyxidicoccus trucidator TaxID=2709662 RepID=UPI0013DBB70E|nr:hypothetical protein [Pyxidicoccus trucidator]
MGSEADEKLTCPRCGGPLGEATVERGYCFAPCLSCDYVMAAPFTAMMPRGVESDWRLSIRWRGESPTLKEAALLRQVLPQLAKDSIQEVRDAYRNTTEWTGRNLSKDTMLQLRAAAEARGFQVESEPEGKNVPRLELPAWPGTFYGVHFSPSFDEKGLIAATFSEAGDTVTIASERNATTSETVAIPSERGLRFLDELAALDPLGIPDALELGADGITLECLIRQEGGVRRFNAWSPDAQHSPRQHGFVLALYRLAADLAREPALVEFLEQLHGYLGTGGLPVKVFEETPRRIRFFGGLSSPDAEALEAFFASLPPEEPLLMDLSGFEGMGTLLHPLFARFHARPGRTAWWVNRSAARHLTAAGVPGTCLHPDLESALAAL